MATYQGFIYWGDLTPEAQERLSIFHNKHYDYLSMLEMEIEPSEDNLLFTQDDTNVYFDDEQTELYIIEEYGVVQDFFITKFQAIANVTDKTQIGDLICGAQKLFTNPDRDYTGIQKQPDSSAFIGSSAKECAEVWEKVTTENTESMTILLLNQEIELTANWSQSRKSCTYNGVIPVAILNHFGITECKNTEQYRPSISIQIGDRVQISNGKNGHTYICPSFITILP